LGLQPLAKPELASPTVTCIPLPEGMGSADFLHWLQKDHGIFTLPGLSPYRDTAIRIGHMGVTASPRYVLHTLYAIESVLVKMGHRVVLGAAVNRAEQVYAGADAREPVKAVSS
jgi:aspartate aminotransferase-like enzyme